MADTDISSSSVCSTISENHLISERCCKKTKMADTSISTSTITTKDFISELPDEILCEILSYIPTKHAVATSILSKRWNHVWTSVPNLDFFSPYAPNALSVTHYLNFVDRVLSLNHVSRVRKIDLGFNEECDTSRINAGISAIITRDSEEFNLQLPRSCLIEKLDQSSHIYSPPVSFFTRENLVELSLANMPLKVPTLVYFPSLKTIYFKSVQLLDDVSMKNLLSGCPILSKLFIRRAAWNNAHTLYICSSTLNYLKIVTWYCNKDFGYKVVIDAPNLNRLALTDEVELDYDIINLSSLVKVKVNVNLEEEEEGRVQTDMDVFNVRLFELLRKISHVKDLCFDRGTIYSFRNALLENVPIFSNLTRMKVKLVYYSWYILPRLFHCAPNLVSFILEKENVHPHCGWYEPNGDVPQCFLSTLKNVVINYFEGGCDDEMEIINYFLQNAIVLKKLVINSFNIKLEEETDILKRLLILPRSSSICQVDYQNLRS